MLILELQALAIAYRSKV